VSQPLGGASYREANVSQPLGGASQTVMRQTKLVVCL